LDDLAEGMQAEPDPAVLDGVVEPEVTVVTQQLEQVLRPFVRVRQLQSYRRDALTGQPAGRGDQVAAVRLRKRLGCGHGPHLPPPADAPAFTPGRSRDGAQLREVLFNGSPSVSAGFGRMFACPGTVLSRPPRRWRACCGTARTPGTCGTCAPSR